MSFNPREVRELPPTHQLLSLEERKSAKKSRQAVHYSNFHGYVEEETLELFSNLQIDIPCENIKAITINRRHSINLRKSINA